MRTKKNQSHGNRTGIRSDRPIQTREAMKLLDQGKIPHTKSCGIEEYKKIQSVSVLYSKL